MKTVNKRFQNGIKREYEHSDDERQNENPAGNAVLIFFTRVAFLSAERIPLSFNFIRYSVNYFTIAAFLRSLSAVSMHFAAVNDGSPLEL